MNFAFVKVILRSESQPPGTYLSNSELIHLFFGVPFLRQSLNANHSLDIIVNFVVLLLDRCKLRFALPFLLSFLVILEGFPAFHELLSSLTLNVFDIGPCFDDILFSVAEDIRQWVSNNCDGLKILFDV